MRAVVVRPAHLPSWSRLSNVAFGNKTACAWYRFQLVGFCGLLVYTRTMKKSNLFGLSYLALSILKESIALRDVISCEFPLGRLFLPLLSAVTPTSLASWSMQS